MDHNTRRERRSILLLSTTIRTMEDTGTTGISSAPEADADAEATPETNEATKITPPSSPAKKTNVLGNRLASGMQSVADKSKQAFSKAENTVQTAAKAAGNLSIKTATLAAKAVKQGGQQVTSTISKTVRKVESSEDLPEAPSSDELSEPASRSLAPSEAPLGPDTTNSNIDSIHHDGDDRGLKRFASSFSSSSVGMNDDHLIVWAVVASIAFVHTMPNLGVIVHERTVPLPVALSWMLVAFTVGMEVDGAMLVETIKYYLLGPNLATAPTASASSTTRDPTMDITNAMTERSYSESVAGRRPNPIRFVSRFLPVTPRNPKVKSQQPKTSLKRSNTSREQALKHVRLNKMFVRRLARFGRTPKEAGSKEGEDGGESSPTIETTSAETSQSMMHGIGQMDSSHTDATVLLSKIHVQRMSQLRGLDIFLTDCAEAVMSSHPFLLRNGLRSVPTFLVNIMTQWGTILIYYELPDWVVDASDSLVENENDPDNVKALKRFLTGDDEYRRPRLKILFEFVQAPYPIRLMAPKDAEIPVYHPGFIETSYYSSHEPHTDDCPIWEVTLDLLGNSAIRGMASLVKRYLGSMSVDFGLVLSKPDGQKEDEPECILGLWRLDHINVSQYPTLPDRFETTGGTTESMDVARASLLVAEASKRVLVEA